MYRIFQQIKTWCSASYILYWNDKQYFCQQWLFVPCCIQWWKLETPHVATQHARDSRNVNVFWAVSSNKVLRYHIIGNYRHSHRGVMEVWMMSHFGKDDRITFLWRYIKDSPCTKCLRILIYPKLAFQVAVNQKKHTHCLMFAWEWLPFLCVTSGDHTEVQYATTKTLKFFLYLWIS